MWILKLNIKHDCTIGNRCEKFNCQTISTPLTQYTEKGFEYALGQHVLLGEQKNIDKFIKNLKNDKRAAKLERKGNTIYLLEKHKGIKIAARLYHSKMFFVRPCIIDNKGNESWEVCAFDKATLIQYINDIKEQKTLTSKVEKIHQSKIKDIHYPKIMPNISQKQKAAFELAIQEGYYHFPRKTELKKLAKLLNISLSTYQEHLRKAEEKIIPSLN